MRASTTFEMRYILCGNGRVIDLHFVENICTHTREDDCEMTARFSRDATKKVTTIYWHNKDRYTVNPPIRYKYVVWQTFGDRTVARPTYCVGAFLIELIIIAVMLKNESIAH